MRLTKTSEPPEETYQRVIARDKQVVAAGTRRREAVALFQVVAALAGAAVEVAEEVVAVAVALVAVLFLGESANHRVVVSQLGL